jgi:hypothetical protein
MTDDPNFKVLDETDALVLGHVFEQVCLLDKTSGQQLLADDFYGDPQCGVISATNDWAVVAGEHIAV